MESNQNAIKKSILLYIIPARIQSLRLKAIKIGAKKNGYRVSDILTKNVTHVLTELDSEELIRKQIPSSISIDDIEIVSLQWFFESVKSGKINDIENYSLKRKLNNVTKEIPSKISKKNIYLCQKPTVLSHDNQTFVKALEVLAREAELRENGNDYSRALAFRKACTALKQIGELKHFDEISKLHDIGQHSSRVITEILEQGYSKEVVELENSDWFKGMSELTSIYGVGPSTARKWFNQGCTNLERVKSTNTLWRKNPRICFGLAFYEDLKSPLTLEEAQTIKKIVKNLLPVNCLIEVTGGFRRGKTEGHDLDLLITSPDEEYEVGILEDLFAKLKTKGLIIHGEIEKHSKPGSSKASSSRTIDNFDKCFTILKYEKDYPENFKIQNTEISFYKDIENLAKNPRSWKAKRVDLVVCPFSQWAFALLGWTGNKMFNRSLRDYSSKEMNMRLTSHGLYDITKRKNITAQDEKEIFSILNLDYLEPWERNA